MSLQPEFDKEALPTRTWAEIDLDTLRGNVAVMRRLAGRDGEPMAVVKADAYGHGAVPIARACAAAGIGHFGVATVQEGRELREAGIKADIYILSSTLPEEASDLVGYDLIPFISSFAQWRSLERAQFAAKTAAFHARIPTPHSPRCVLVLDTGMGREGCYFDEARAIYELCTDPDVRPVWLAGVATHFSSADEPGWGDNVTAEQAENFLDAIRRMTIGCGDRGVYLTLANSPGTLRWQPKAAPLGMRGFLIRCGLLTYGIEPYAGAFADAPELRPVLSWCARVTLVREMPAGATVGYGQTYTLTRPSRIATLAVGYADGLSRKLSNRGVIIVAGHRYKIVGRVSMDQCQIDVTNAREPVNVGDVATLIGTDGGESQTVLQMAELCETTPHEPTCRLTARVPRLYRGSA